MQSRLRHHSQKTERFQRDRLTARIRSGDDQAVVMLADRHVDRHDRFSVKQGVARAVQLDLSSLLDMRSFRLHFNGKASASEDKGKLNDVMVI